MDVNVIVEGPRGQITLGKVSAAAVKLIASMADDFAKIDPEPKDCSLLVGLVTYVIEADRLHEVFGLVTDGCPMVGDDLEAHPATPDEVLAVVGA